ncbi:MAG: ATP-binding cassette domain-containing protein [Deltaproteobacteria bacterium]|nr:ATP-binding cassette domain-containing protein [Deltaproteobacteria bacterium]
MTPAVRWDRLRFGYPDQPPLLELGPFCLPAGGAAAVLGPSGSGKSTLLSLVAGQLRPSAGHLEVLGGPPGGAAHRVGWVLQGAPTLDALDLVENVLLPLRLHPGLAVDGAARARARALLDELGLGAAAGRRPTTLSAGERQRVALARALINDPALILADEPTTGLDPARATEALALLRGACARRGAALLLVSHDPAASAGLSQRVVLGAGKAGDDATQVILGESIDDGRGAAPPATPPAGPAAAPAPAAPPGAAVRAAADALRLGWAGLRAHPARSLSLAAGLGLAIGLPAWTTQAASAVRGIALDRAGQTPLLLVPRGEAVDGALAALRLRPGPPPRLPSAAAAALRAGPGGADATIVPLHLRHSADGVPIVGAGAEYFAARGLRAATGRTPGLLGEVVLGAAVAEARGWGPGDRVRSDLRGLYDLAGAYPLRLPVVGVLAPTGGPDDHAIFTSLHTAWALDGHLHGHSPAEQAPLPGDDPEDGNVEASAAVFMIQDLDEASRGRFHLHGDPGALPVSSLAIFPADAAATDLLLGQIDAMEGVEAAVPRVVVEDLLAVLEVAARGVRAALLVVGGAAVAFAALVVQLGLQARAAERALLARLGASRRRILLLIVVEHTILGVGALALAGGLVGVGLWALRRALGAG